MPKVRTLPSRVPAQGNRLATMQPGSWRSDKASSTQRGYGYKWQQARLAFLQQHALCVMCKAGGKVVEATIVDHKVPHRGDLNLFWNRKNWQALCKPHHDSAKQREDQQHG